MEYRGLREIVAEEAGHEVTNNCTVDDDNVTAQYIEQLMGYADECWGKHVIEYEVIRDALVVVLRHLSSWPEDSMLANDIDWMLCVVEVSLLQAEERTKYNSRILSSGVEGKLSFPEPRERLHDIINVLKEHGYKGGFIHFFIGLGNDIINKFTYSRPYAPTQTFYYMGAGSIIGRCGPILREAIREACHNERKFPIKLSFVTALLEIINRILFDYMKERQCSP